jgi:hypothetical protein
MGFANIDDIVSKLPGEVWTLTKGSSLTVGSPGYWRDLFYDNGSYVGSNTQILSANQGGTYFVSSHVGAILYSNPNSVSAESLCVGRVEAWNIIPNDTLLLYDRVWGCRGIHANTTATAAVASLAPVRSFDSSKAQLWLTLFAPRGNTAQNITINYKDTSNTDRTITFNTPMTGSLYANIAVPLLQVGQNGLGILRVTSVAASAGSGAAGEFGLVIGVPKLNIPMAGEARVMDAFRTGLSLVSSNECLALMYNSNTVNFNQCGVTLNLIKK